MPSEQKNVGKKNVQNGRQGKTNSPKYKRTVSFAESPSLSSVMKERKLVMRSHSFGYSSEYSLKGVLDELSEDTSDQSSVTDHSKKSCKSVPKTSIYEKRTSSLCDTKLLSFLWFLIHVTVYISAFTLLFYFFNPESVKSTRLDLADLNGILRSKVYGQDIAIDTTIKAVNEYLLAEDFSQPLILLFVGCTGCGKTYMASLISEYYPASESKVVSHHVANWRNYRGEAFIRWVQRFVYTDRVNMFTFDDVDLKGDFVENELKLLFNQWKGKDSPTIFILISSGNNSIMDDYVLEMYDPEKGFLDVEYKALCKTCSSILQGWMVERNFQIVPFVPIARKDVLQCIRKDLLERNLYSEKLTKAIAEELEYYPEDEPKFSLFGCKPVHIKIALNTETLQ